MSLINPDKLAILYHRTVDYIKQLRDVRVLGVHVFLVIALLVTWSGVGVIQTNYQLQKKLSEIRQENEVLALQNANLRLRNQYFDTEQYLELTARRQFGLAASGEKLLLIPKETALNNSVESPDFKQPQPESLPQKPQYQQNFEAWMEFFFRHNQRGDSAAS